MSQAISVRERVEGALLGLAAGDALGVPVEFEDRAARAADPVRGMRSGGTWRVSPGTWSDDTSLALCLAESIVERGFDPEDSGRRFLAWLDEGLWTARGEAFDVGGATRRALGRIRAGMPATRAGGRGENDNGNGSLMRILPASIWLSSLPGSAKLAGIAAYSSVTHGHPRSVLGCWLHCLVAAHLLEGATPREAYSSAVEEARDALPNLPPSLRAEAGSYVRVLDGDLDSLGPSAIRGSGYVVHCLEASLWCLLRTSSFSDCVLAAVNLGEDSDTTGAVAGGLAGLAYGRSGIDEAWIGELARSDEIAALAGSLASLVATRPPLPRSYWVLPGKLLAGGYPGRPTRGAGIGTRAELELLAAAGVDAFLDLTEGAEYPEDYAPVLAGLTSAKGLPMVRKSVPMRDMSADETSLELALAEIDAFLAAGRTVYVHCLGGMGRTGMVAASFLATRGLAASSAAAAVLRELRSRTDRPEAESPQTEAQRRLVATRKPGSSAYI
jgi:ADP-ribosylglycohydrolase